MNEQSALNAAAKEGEILPVFIWAPDEENPTPPGSASRSWLHRSLQSLAADIDARGGTLAFRKGPTLEALLSVAREVGVSKIFCSSRYEPAARQQELLLRKRLGAEGIEFTTLNSSLIVEPGRLLNLAGGPYQVFTPFLRAWLRQLDVQAQESPAPLRFSRKSIPSISLNDLQIEPRIAAPRNFYEWNVPGETGALQQLARFRSEGAERYATARDRMDLEGTSRMSAHLHFGEISPKRVLVEAKEAMNSEKFVAELAWREFAYHLLWHYPQLADSPLKPEFSRIRYREDADLLTAWIRGQTGYPVVDAAMRQLWQTGWMHNRARMIAASFLVKDLLIDWRKGAAWFWDALVDADLANNSMGWQWVAGCGPDAAPFFRIFNPTTQGQKFDPQGVYVRRWVPELRGMPDKFIHDPAKAPAKVLDAAGVHIGKSYPTPIISHIIARDVALEAYQRIRR